MKNERLPAIIEVTANLVTIVSLILMVLFQNYNTLLANITSKQTNVSNLLSTYSNVIFPLWSEWQDLSTQAKTISYISEPVSKDDIIVKCIVLLQKWESIFSIYSKISRLKNLHYSNRSDITEYEKLIDRRLYSEAFKKIDSITDNLKINQNTFRQYIENFQKETALADSSFERNILTKLFVKFKK